MAMALAGRARAAGRLAVFAVGSWLVVARAIRTVLAPFPQRWRVEGPHVSRWARLGARCLGIRVRRTGELPPPGSLVVANHQTYADVVTLGGLFPSVFAARHDMRRWPLFGALAASGATIFIDRERKRAGARGIEKVQQALAAGATVIGFPEGTSTDGRDLLPFRSGLFHAAVAAGAPVVPAAIRYREIDGAPIAEADREVVAWYRGEPFLHHLMRFASHSSVLAEVELGTPIAGPHAGRRELAAAAEAALRGMLGLPPRAAAPAAGDEAVELEVGR